MKPKSKIIPWYMIHTLAFSPAQSPPELHCCQPGLRVVSLTLVSLLPKKLPTSFIPSACNSLPPDIRQDLEGSINTQSPEATFSSENSRRTGQT